MTLLYDPQLLSQLLQTVQIKKAQVAPPDPDAVKALAGKLLENLAQASSISTDSSDALLFMRDMQSLDQLVEFLKEHNMKYAGQSIVMENYAALDPQIRALYVPYKQPGAGVEAFKTGQTLGIYKEGLVAYLKDLQQKAKSAGGNQEQLLTTLLGKLLEEANTTLKLGVSSSDLQTTEQGTQPFIAPDQPLDSVNEIVILENPLTPARDQGTLKITPAVLQNKMAFDTFARQVKVQKGQETFDYEKHTSENFICDILQVLHARATQFAYRRGAYLDKAYVQMVETLAGQYSCSVGGTGTGATPYQHTGFQQETGQSGQTLTPAGQKAAMTLIENGPFRGDRIDLVQIDNWLASYATLAPQVKAQSNTVANIQNARQILQGIKDKYQVSRQSFAYDAAAVVSSIMASTPGDRARKVNAPNAYLNQLKDLVNIVGNILTDFRGDIYDQLRDERWQRALDEQIGEGASSFYNITIDKISEWLSDVSAALQQVAKQGF